jgi:hypothetical protein
MRPTVVVLSLAGCLADLGSPSPRTRTASDSDSNPGTPYDGPTPGTPYDGPTAGGFGVRSGLGLVEITSVTGPGERCGEDPPFVVGDTTGDGAPELVLACGVTDSLGRTLTNVFLLDGAAALAGTFTSLASVAEVYTDGVTAVGDLDADGLADLGFGLAWSSFSNDEIPWWFVRPGVSLVGETDVTDGALVVTGDGEQYGNGAPVGVGDVDLDGVPDLASWQRPGVGSSVLHLLSGADLLAFGTVSAITGALRTIDGLETDEGIEDITAIGDLDGDGHVDLAAVVGDTSGPYGQDNHVAVTLVRGLSVTDPGTTMRIHGSAPGRDRHGQVVNLGDLDGDRLPELAALLATFSSSKENGLDVAVIPSHVLAAGIDVPVAPYALGPASRPFGTIWSGLVACDLDGDGLAELVTDDGTWDGRDLLVPGSAPIGPGVPLASCAGDVDGVPGSEILAGKPEGF